MTQRVTRRLSTQAAVHSREPHGAGSAPSAPSSGSKRSKPKEAGQLYGEWTHKPSQMGNRPRWLFSGPEREGDLAQQLVGKGWAVCSVDLEQLTPTNLLDQGTRQLIIADVDNEMFDHIHLGTPCETFSPLRENPPGPKPLRSASQVEGLKEGLNQKEVKQLKEGNEHVAFS